MTRTEALQHGMQKKWDRHFKGRTRLIAQWCVMGSILIVLVNCVLWPQFLFVETFNSIMEFELVLDQQDADANDWTYRRFQIPQIEKNSAIHKFYLWHVQDPEIVVDLVGVGSKLALREKGPFTVRQVKQRYDVSFSGEDSQFMKWKEWDYFEEVTDPNVCIEMFQRTTLGLDGAWDMSCPGENCHYCQDWDTEVTVVNPTMIKMIQQYGSEHILAVLSQPAFALTELYLTQSFPTAVKAQKSEDAFEAVFMYRKAVMTLRLLQDSYALVLSNNGSSVTHKQFTLNSDESDVHCGDPDVDGFGGRCPWGAGREVNSMKNRWDVNGTSELTEEDVQWMFDESWAFSLFNESVGMPLWISAARYLNVIKDSLFESSSWENVDDRSGPRAAFLLLANETFNLGYSRSIQHARAKVNGVVIFVFNNWYTSGLVHSRASAEWASTNSSSTVACDAGGYYSGWQMPVSIPGAGLQRNFSVYRCNWALAPFIEYYKNQSSGYWHTTELNISLAAELVDPDRVSLANELGVLMDQNRNDLWEAYRYCNATSVGMSTGCAGMEDAVSMAQMSFPKRLALQNGEDFQGSNNRKKFQDLTCALAAWLFEGWSQNNRWMDEYVMHWMTQRHPAFEFSADHMEDLGYAQFAGGYVTEALFDEPGVASIMYSGYWKFAPEDYQVGSWTLKKAVWKTGEEDRTFFWKVGTSPEFHVSAIKKGFPFMNLTVADGATLLQVLATDNAESIAFRKHMTQAHNTYYCNGPGMQVHSGNGGKYDCDPGEAFFTVWNPYADFSWDSPKAEFDADAIDYKFFSQEELLDLGQLMNESFTSTEAACDFIEQMYEDCSFYVDDRYDTVVWLDDCEQWSTLTSNAFGINCGDDDVHKRGNIVAEMIHAFTMDRILIDGLHICNDPVTCDYRHGGLFATTTARNLVFESRVDSIYIKMLNHDLQDRNLSIACVNQTVVDVTTECGFVRNHDCTDQGYQVLYENALGEKEILLTVDRDGPERWQWYKPEIQLPNGHGEINNPAYSTHAGQLWNNESFHKERNCEHRILGGPKGRFQNCEVQAHTGRHDLSSVGHTTSWYGNATLDAAPPSTREFDPATGASRHTADVAGSQGEQFTPQLFDGFKSLSLPYVDSDPEESTMGLKFLGNKSETLLLGDQLLVMHLEREKQYRVRWPYPLLNGSAREFSFRANRYQESEQDWLDASNRTGSTLRDQKGMPYKTPIGMASIESVAGVPAFMSTVRFYGNRLWGNSQESQKVTGDFAYTESTATDADGNRYAPSQYKFFLDVEPVTGRTVRKALRLQLNYRVEANALFPYIMSDESSLGCTAPSTVFLESSGYGCFVFHPFMWVEEAMILDYTESSRLNYGYFDVRAVMRRVLLRSALLAMLMFLGGMCVWRRENRKEEKFRARIYLD